MQWMDCLADFGPLQPNFIRVKPCQGKTAYLGGVFHPFRGLMGDRGVTAREGSFLGHR